MQKNSTIIYNNCIYILSLIIKKYYSKLFGGIVMNRNKPIIKNKKNLIRRIKAAVLAILLITVSGQSLCMSEVNEESVMNSIVNYNRFFIKYKDSKTVIDYFNKKLKAEPKDQFGYLYLSMQYSILNQKNEAIKNLKKAIEIDSTLIKLARRNDNFKNIKDSDEFINLMGTIIKVNGRELGSEEKAVVQNKKVLIPVEPLFKAIGAKVQKLGDKSLIISDKQNTLILKTGKNEVANKKEVVLDNPISGIGGSLFINYADLKKCWKLDVKWIKSSSTIYVRTPSKKPYYTDEQMEWALGLGAITNQMNGHLFNVLGGDLPTKSYIAEIKQSLESAWGVRGRTSAFETIKWLKEEGHSKEFKGFLAYIPDEKYNAFLNDPDEADGTKAFLKFLKQTTSNGSKTLDNYKKNGLMAWDYSRLVHVCGLAYIAGYITYDEAWNEIMEAAKKVQKAYTDWKNFGYQYSLGRYFWSESKDKYNSCNMAVIMLGWYSESPWVMYDWNLNLNKHAADC